MATPVLPARLLTRTVTWPVKNATKEKIMLDHIGLSVSDVERSKAFYEAALKPLGATAMMVVTEEMTGGHGSHVGFGKDQPQFWISTGKHHSPGVHVAFAADNRQLVDDFYRAAIAAGGKDNGKPGLRPHYHENYYGAFVLDPDGHNIEAVCHAPAKT
jgi:catechol 2,3-dioxygenase-like lactoylglutathione lyase family enzyme